MPWNMVGDQYIFLNSLINECTKEATLALISVTGEKPQDHVPNSSWSQSCYPKPMTFLGKELHVLTMPPVREIP